MQYRYRQHAQFIFFLKIRFPDLQSYKNIHYKLFASKIIIKLLKASLKYAENKENANKKHNNLLQMTVFCMSSMYI